MSQPQARYRYTLDPPVLQCDMDELIHDAVEYIADAESCLAKFINHLEENRRNPDEVDAAIVIRKAMKEIERSRAFDDLSETARKWKARQ